MTEPLRYPGVTIYDAARGHRIVWRENGQRRQAQRASLDAACALAVDVSRRIADVEPAGSDASLETVAAEWLQVGEASDGWSKSYVSKQRSILDVWILPNLGGPVRLLTRAQLAAVATKVREGVGSDQYAAQILGTLKRVWVYAIQSNLIPKDREAWATMAVRGRRVQGHSREFVDPSERPSTDAVIILLSLSHKTDQDWTTTPVHEWVDPTPTPMTAAIILGAFCGLRWGEMAALEVDDIDFDAGVVRVSRQVSYVDGVREIKLPKGGKVRETVLPPSMADELRAALPESGLVCPAPSGDYDQPNRFYDRFRKVCEAADWPKDDAGKWRWSYHSLRHHFATWLLGKGVPVEDVAMMMGHASPDVTWRTYVGVAEGALGRAREATRSL